MYQHRYIKLVILLRQIYCPYPCIGYYGSFSQTFHYTEEFGRSTLDVGELTKKIN